MKSNTFCSVINMFVFDIEVLMETDYYFKDDVKLHTEPLQTDVMSHHPAGTSQKNSSVSTGLHLKTERYLVECIPPQRTNSPPLYSLIDTIQIPETLTSMFTVLTKVRNNSWMRLFVWISTKS